MRKSPSGWRLPCMLGLAVLLIGANGADLPPMNTRMLRLMHYLQMTAAAREAGDLESAVKYQKLALKVQPLSQNSQYNMACLHSLTGHTDEALESLNLAVRHGWEDSDWMKKDTDLDGLRKLDRFTELLDAADACRAETVTVIAPEGLDATKPVPLVVALHGFSSVPREFAAYWREAAEELGVVVAAPKGLERVGEGGHGYGWFIPRRGQQLSIDAFAEAVDKAIEAASKAYKIDPDQVILAGHSQGADVAMMLLANHPDKYAGGITLGASFDAQLAKRWMDNTKNNPLRVCYIVGKSDRTSLQAHDANRVLEEAGHQVRLVEVPGVGHEIPENHQALFAEAMRFVLNR